MRQFIRKLIPDINQRTLRQLNVIVEQINKQEQEFSLLSNEEIQKKSAMLREQVQADNDLEKVLVEAFALGREAAKRTLGQRHYDVQLLAGLVLSQGKIAEMKTGEGKTLAATLPAYLHGLTGKGVHIVTVNDYLAQRDAVWMGQVYDFLGLRVACLIHNQSFWYNPDYQQKTLAGNDVDTKRDVVGGFKVFHEYLQPVTRQQAYQADIIYGTNHEFGFDYLRDNLAYESAQTVQRGLYYAIVDEIDSILIDEARTPLIISGPAEDAAQIYKEFARIVPRLQKDLDYTIDEKHRAVLLTEAGIEQIERLLGRQIYSENNLVLIHHLERALQAYALYHRDKDYVVKNGEVVLVDEFTGRLLFGRRYEGGLHQAIEAKEGLRVQAENRTMATITLQNYFRMYKVLAGMTGTAATSAEEFYKVYGLDVVVIPTNKPMIRKDLPDKVFLTSQAKFRAVVQEVRKRHEYGQPVLVGTISIEKNEYLSALLKREGIPHQILNAKQHEREAEIIAQAGKKGAVTVATNMAGRGVDIILGGNPPDADEAEEVRRLGGLHVIGTERHESRRIDNQLRGRAGRQGDPGSSQFFVSLEDDLMRIFGSENIQGIVSRLGIPADSDLEIENRLVSRALDSAQAKVEGLYFDTRKRVLEFDDVLNKQREVLYSKRRKILFASDKELEEYITQLQKDVFRAILKSYQNNTENQKGDIIEFFKELGVITVEEKRRLDTLSEEELQEYLELQIEQQIEQKKRVFKERFIPVVRLNLLVLLDMFWADHLDFMNHLRDSAGLRAYGQRDPLVEYRTEGHRAFQELLGAFEWQAFFILLRIK